MSLNSSIKNVSHAKNLNDTSKTKRTSFVSYVKCALKGALVSMVFTVAIILLFALIIKETGMSDSVIAVINQVIKIGGIVAASYFAIRGTKLKQWLCGAMAGVMFILLNYLVFSLIEGMFGNVALLFSDLLMGLLIGMVFAIIVANFFNRSKAPKKTPRKKRMSKVKV